MKKCPSCGAEIEDGANICNYCGMPCDGAAEEEPAAVTVTEETPAAGFAAEETPVDKPEETVNPAVPSQYSMGWHRFLMVVMIIGGIITIVNGLSTLLGGQYAREGLEASRVYSVYPGLKSADIFSGVVMIALGVFQFIVRNRLNQFRANGPFSLKVLYGLSIAASLIYLAWAGSVVDMNMFSVENLGNVGGSVVMLIINSIYYSKRADLFVN